VVAATVLTENDRGISKKFRCRGSAVLNWNRDDDGGRKLEQLRKFYKASSTVLHGDEAGAEELAEVREIGEAALRDVWWWFFEQSLSRKEATKMIGDRILAT